MSCQKDIMDIAKCLYESPKVKEIIVDVMVAIATKDFSKLWPKIKEALPELIPVMIKCVMKDNENEINLTSTECTKGKNLNVGFYKKINIKLKLKLQLEILLLNILWFYLISLFSFFVFNIFIKFIFYLA